MATHIFFGIFTRIPGCMDPIENGDMDPIENGDFSMSCFSGLCGGHVRSLWRIFASINVVEKNSVKLRRDTNLSLNHDSGEDAKLYINHQNPQPAFLGVM